MRKQVSATFVFHSSSRTMVEGQGEAEVVQQFESLQLEPSTSAPGPLDAVEGERRKGTVRWFNASKGFGFIQPEGVSGEEEDLFVHQVRAYYRCRLYIMICRTGAAASIGPTPYSVPWACRASSDHASRICGSENGPFTYLSNLARIMNAKYDCTRSSQPAIRSALITHARVCTSRNTSQLSNSHQRTNSTQYLNYMRQATWAPLSQHRAVGRVPAWNKASGVTAQRT